jgi:L-iditol 2-dehydrogenase
MPVEKAVLSEPFACSLHAIDRAKITKDDIVVISGAGCLGLGMITAAKNLNPDKIISLDLVDKRLEKAKEFGSDMCFNPLKQNVQKLINDITEGYGCDVYIEATGHPDSVVQGLKMIKKGGRFIEFSLFNEPVTCNWSVIGDGKELDLYGVSLSPFCFPRIIAGLYDGRIKSRGVVTHSFKLSEFEKAFKICMNDNQSIKVILKP